MKVHHVSGYAMYRVATGRRDRFLEYRRVPWGMIFGWLVLIGSAIGWGWIVAQALIEAGRGR